MNNKIVTSFLVFISAVLVSNLGYAQLKYYSGEEFTESLGNGINGPVMIVVPTGKLTIDGVNDTEENGLGDIEFENSFAISQTEITQGLYSHYLNDINAPESHFIDSAKGQQQLPVYGITWDEAEAFAGWLSRKTGHNYRLPSSSEWEYAARAGSKSRYSWGNSVGKEQANCKGCKSSKWNGNPLAVKSYPANDWNIYDMHGNVWEWTKDCMDPNSAPPGNGSAKLFGNCNLRELRGGSAQSDAWSIRILSVAYGQKDMRSRDVGLRVVMDIPNQ